MLHVTSVSFSSCYTREKLYKTSQFVQISFLSLTIQYDGEVSMLRYEFILFLPNLMFTLVFDDRFFFLVKKVWDVFSSQGHVSGSITFLQRLGWQWHSVSEWVCCSLRVVPKSRRNKKISPHASSFPRCDHNLRALLLHYKKKIENSFDFLRGMEKTRVSIFHLRNLRKFVWVRSQMKPGLKFIP